MSARPPGPWPPPTPARARVSDAPSIYAALVLFGLTVAAGYLLLRLQLLLIILFFALLVATGIAGPVRRIERFGLPRALSILVVYLAIVGVLGLMTWYVLPRMLGQAADAAADLPRRIRDLEDYQRRIGELSREYPILRDLDERLLDIAARTGTMFTGWLLELPGAVAKAVFVLFSVFTIAFMLLMAKERILSLVLSLVHPRHRPTTQRVLSEMGERMGGYLRAKLIVVVIVGTLVWATLTALGSEYAILVGIFAGVSEVVPRIGPWFGRAAILLAALPLGWQSVAIAMIAHVVIENLKGYVISPLVESGQVDIHPLTAFIAIIAGGILLGWLGALIAVPAAAAIQVVVQDVAIPWRRKRLESAEAAYALGPPAPATARAGDGVARPRRPQRLREARRPELDRARTTGSGS